MPLLSRSNIIDKFNIHYNKTFSEDMFIDIPDYILYESTIEPILERYENPDLALKHLLEIIKPITDANEEKKERENDQKIEKKAFVDRKYIKRMAEEHFNTHVTLSSLSDIPDYVLTRNQIREVLNKHPQYNSDILVSIIELFKERAKEGDLKTSMRQISG